ncbi:NHL repeat-containing protein [Ekhidna sp.]
MRRTLYFLLTICTLSISAQGLRELYQEGVKAYEEENYELFTNKMLAIDAMRPNYPAVVYNIAAGYALTDQPTMALEVLNKYILMDATRDFTQDKDFNSIKELPAFVSIQERQKELTATLGLSKSMEYSVYESHPESITYSNKQKAFFIGGVRDGNIWKIEDGKEPQLWAESVKNSWSVMGLEVSSDEKTLWVCTSSMTYYEAYDQSEEGFASVLKYDIKNGKLLETYALPGGHNFGDLISDKKGNIYISDGTANILYRISEEKGKLETYLDLSEKVFNLQGLSLDEKRNVMYLSDYIDGIYRLDLSTKALEKLEIKAEDILIKGIDGLYYYDNTLLGLHNGTNPNRVVRYTLAEDGKSITGKQVIAQGGQLGEPTQGVWLNGEFYFIMNSPWGAYDRDGNFEPSVEKLNIGVIK